MMMMMMMILLLQYACFLINLPMDVFVCLFLEIMNFQFFVDAVSY